ncbi:MAG: hypothetical protein IKU84_05715 [Clostridia bacterium]|nr:hypothetical protein [Clostridia bacterium]
MTTKEYVESLSIEEKVAYMIIVRGENYIPRLHEMAKDGHLGGVGAVAIPKESRTPEKLVEIMNSLREESPLPITFYADAEHGLAVSVPFATRFPSAMALGAAGDLELARLNAQAIGREARVLGFNIVASPTLDVNIEPENPIICTRAFSDDTDTVIKFGRAYLEGLQSEGRITCGKHFPGHGATATDSHMTMPVVDRTREELDEVELRPYREICNDMWGVMTAHIFFPALAGEGEVDVPATMSRTMLYKTLREDIGFDNLIVSDSLTMKGIKDKYGLDASVGAILAGHDMILQDYSDDPIITYNHIVQAVKDGRIPMEWIDASVERILKFQEKSGATVDFRADIDEVLRVVGCEEHIKLAKTVAARGVTFIEGANVPMKADAMGKTLIIATVGPEEIHGITDIGAAGGFSSTNIGVSVNRYCKADLERISETPEPADVDRVIELAKGYDTVIFAPFVRTVSYKVNGGKVHPEILRLAEAVNNSDSDTVALVFGNPYSLAVFPEFKNCILSYGDDVYSIDASVNALFGAEEMTAKLPVQVSDKYPRGYSYKK